MARGQPDFGMYAVKEVTASVSDMGEVAARLGSIVTYDKRGDVVDFDNFEDVLLKWIVDPDAGCYARHDSTYTKSGSQAVKLYATGAGNSVTLYKQQSPSAAKRLGFEFSFSTLANTVNLEFDVDYYDGADHYEAIIRIDPVALTLSLITTGDVWKTIATFERFTDKTFYTVKLVLDFATGYYVRALFGENEYDISAYAIIVSVDARAPFLAPDFELLTKAAAAGEVWIDDYVSTQAEP